MECVGSREELRSSHVGVGGLRAKPDTRGVGMEVGVLVSTAGFRHQAKTKGLQSGVDIGVKYSEKQERNFDDATMKAGQCVIGLQVGLRDWTGP